MLNLEDLKRGLDWLGLKIDHVVLLGFIKELDKDQDGFINLDEFKGAVGFEDDGTMAQNMTAFNGGMPLPPMPSDDQTKAIVKIPEPVLAAIKVKVKKVTKFTQIWTSQGSMSRQKISIWEPVVSSTILRQNKVSISMGHFHGCLLYTSPSPRDQRGSRMPSSA